MRAAAVTHLGDCCARCGFDDPRALQIDHVLSDGNVDRNTKSTWQILQSVLASIPGERFQLLCANCNWIKRHELGEHRGPITAESRR